MEQLQNYWAQYLSFQTKAFAEIQTFTGLSAETLQIIGWVLLAYAVLFLLVLPLHRYCTRKKLWLQKSLIMQIDEMIYLLAKHQHLLNLDLGKLWWNPNIALMKTIFWEGKYDYIQSWEVILMNIHKVEQVLWKKVISLESEQALAKEVKNYYFTSVFWTVLKWILGISTLGIYFLIG